MKNYYNLKKQLDLCLIRLETLKEQRELLNSFLSPRTFKINLVSYKGGEKADPFTIYANNIVSLEKQIEFVKKEINILQNNIHKMDMILRDIDNNLYRIFVYRYLDNLSVDTIAHKTNFSTRRIYQLLNKIDEILNS